MSAYLNFDNVMAVSRERLESPHSETGNRLCPDKGSREETEALADSTPQRHFTALISNLF
jgi:hypothetical protein